MRNSSRIIEIPKVFDERGNLSFAQSNDQIPFQIKRVFWTYDVPGGETRGGHAYKMNQEFIIALSGSLDVVIHDGMEERKYTLNRSYFGLFVPALTWRHLENFSTNAVALTLSSTLFDSSDYVRDSLEYRTLINGF